jgi:hypothetical protein
MYLFDAMNEWLERHEAAKREKLARLLCHVANLDPDELAADGGVEVWMVVEQQYSAQIDAYLED